MQAGQFQITTHHNIHPRTSNPRVCRRKNDLLSGRVRVAKGLSARRGHRRSDFPAGRCNAQPQRSRVAYESPVHQSLGDPASVPLSQHINLLYLEAHLSEDWARVLPVREASRNTFAMSHSMVGSRRSLTIVELGESVCEASSRHRAQGGGFADIRNDVPNVFIDLLRRGHQILCAAGNNSRGSPCPLLSKPRRLRR
jgi:hypothetical protein